MQIQPKVFDIDISVCMSCQICVEVCPFEAIKWTTKYELSTAIASMSCTCAKKICGSPTSIITSYPTEAAEVDRRLAEEKA
jgi:NADH-quinone oxidoreductase subunit I